MSRLISTAAQCRALDNEVIVGLGVPGVALMELASRGIAQVVEEKLGPQAAKGVAVLCGGGNNGGDGFGAARWLHRMGFNVVTVPISASSSGDAQIMRRGARAAGVPEVSSIPEVGVVIDALFGTGLARAITGQAAELIDVVQQRGLPVVAVDLPSGMNPDTGGIEGASLSALHTVTFGRYKPAFFTPGGARAGEVHLVDIGVSRTGHDLAELPGVGELAGWMPRRSLHAYKQSSGHLAVLAGSPEMAGAAVLTCTGAIRAGVGLVTLFIDEKALGRLGALPPTVMVVPGAASASLPNVGAFSALAVGPGLGGGRLLSSELRTALAAHLLTEQPIVADADALHPGMQVGPHVVITPHPGEAGRILGCTSQQVQADRFSAVQELPGVALLKGRHTLVHGPNNRISINPTNSSVLATAGSGDVLTGVIGALLAQGVPPFKAAQLGAWLHGRSGELLASKRATGWSALDIAQALPEAAQELLDVSP